MITFLKKNSAFKLVRPKTRLTVAEMIHSTEQNDTRIRFVVQKVKQASAHCNKKGTFPVPITQLTVLCVSCYENALETVSVRENLLHCNVVPRGVNALQLAASGQSNIATSGSSVKARSDIICVAGFSQ